MQSSRPLQTSVDIDEITGIKEQTALQRIVGSQPFWVLVALVVICLVMSWLQPRAFASMDNFFNITRNFAFVGIMAMGMTAVILTGGIDLSVGSIMGLVGVVCGLILQAEQHWLLAVVGGLAAGVACGAINGGLIAYAGLPPFVVTLGMLSIGRSLAIVRPCSWRDRPTAKSAMSTHSCASPRPSCTILPASSVTSLPSSSFFSRNALPIRRTYSPRLGPGSSRQRRNAACAALLTAS